MENLGTGFLIFLISLSATAGFPQTTSINNNTLDIYKFHVDAEIRLRFARTTVVQSVANRYGEAKEIKFSMELPAEAFISGFEMIINGERRRGMVMEKEAAKKKYDSSRRRKQSAGLVTTNARDTNKFNFKVNVAAESIVSFILTYDELLKRSLGQYEYQLNFKPQQIIEDLRVFVRINETKPIKSFRVPKFMKNFNYAYNDSTDNALAAVNRPSSNVVEVTYTPSVQQQLDMSSRGLHGQFRINYDLVRDQTKPDIEVINGYFVHSFVPAEEEVKLLPKAVIFCLDKSGSMGFSGKMRQLKSAMLSILDDLQPYDKFSIVLFDSSIKLYKGGALVSATEENIKHAKATIRVTGAGGGTNINDAIKSALTRAAGKVNLETHVPIITFLTDGEPTSGETSSSRIRSNIISWNKELHIPIYSLGFGNPGSGMDFDLISKISSENFGYARRIYVDTDASLQIRDFYQSLSSPILKDIEYQYEGALVDELTDTSFPYFYSGSEVMVAGKLEEIDDELSILINALDGEGEYKQEYTVPKSQYVEIAANESRAANTIEKMWAYLTIKQLLRKRDASRDSFFKEESKKKIMDLAIKYQFVTPFTSIIVVDEDEVTTTTTTTSTTTQPITRLATTTASWQNWWSRSGNQNSFADDDPHLYVHVGEVPICFDLYGADGDVFLLFEDKFEDVRLTGKLAARPDKHTHTFFTELQLQVGERRVSFTFSKLKPVMKISQKHDGISIQESANTTTLTIHKKLRFSIHSGAHSFVGRLFPFFGVYISEKSGYKEYCQQRKITGVLGQFFCQKGRIEDVPVAPFEVQHIFPEVEVGLLSVTNRRGVVKQAYAKPGHRHDLITDKSLNCWYLHHQAQQVMDTPIHKLKLNPV